MPSFSLRRALVPILVLAGASPTAAAAEDAPLRVFDIGPTGARGEADLGAQIGPGAREVAFTSRPGGFAGQPPRVLIRNVVAGTSSQVLPGGTTLVGASDDLSRLLYSTQQSFDPADTNGADDLYVFDRATGRSLLATRLPSGGALGEAPIVSAISGDGRIVTYGRYVEDYDHPQTVKVAVDAGTTSTLPGMLKPIGGGVLDRAGSVVATTDGIYVGTRKIALPTGTWASASISGDGSLVALSASFGASSGSLVAVSTATGVLTTLPIPAWLDKQGYTLERGSADGSRVFLSTISARPNVRREVVGAFDVKTKALGQIGSEVVIDGTPYDRLADLTPAADFATTRAAVNQLGATAIPGSAAPVPPIPPYPANTYVGDTPGCSAAGTWPFYAAAQRPTIQLYRGPEDRPYVPVRADVVVRLDSSTQVVNQFAITALSMPRAVTTGLRGAWSYTYKVTFKDGSSVTGSTHVATAIPVPCPIYF